MPSTEDIKNRLLDLQGSFSVDRTEFGKMMILVSATLLLVSIHSFRGFDEAATQLESANNELQQAQNLMQTNRFQEGLDAVESVRGFNPSQIFEEVVNTFESAESAANSTSRAEELVQQKRETYQWYSLIGLMGIVAGIAVIYL